MSGRPTPPLADAALAERIASGASALELPLRPEQIDRFVAYLRLIERWNSTYNLTAVRGPAEMVTHHLLDCLAAGAALLRHRDASRTRRVLDVGSGAGLPGLVLAVLLPHAEVVCLDSVGKKTAFITQAAAVLQARNAAALHARVESLQDPGYDVVVSRAFASLGHLVAQTRRLLADNGEWMALKGREPQAEIDALRAVHVEIEPLHVPGLAGERCIVWMRPDLQ